MSASAASVSWDEEYARAVNLAPEELAEALASPENPVARYLVAELTGIEDPSPTFIIETITALNQAQSEAASQLTHVEVEQHQPGVNDRMSGVVNPAIQPPRTPGELARLTTGDNDSTLCMYHFPTLARLMPYKLFGRRDIVALNIFNAPASIKRLPFEFHTTTLGLKKVWVEVFKGQEQAAYGDEQLLTALLKVGGVPPMPLKARTSCGILYPEDLVPCTEEDQWNDDQRTYWKLLGDLRETSWGDEEAEYEEEVTEDTEHDEGS